MSTKRQPGEALLEIECRIKPEKRREFRLNVADTPQFRFTGRGAPVVYEDQNEAGHLLWQQEWSDAEALGTYLESDEFLALLGGLQVLGTVHDYRVVHFSGESPRHPDSGSPRELRGWRFIGSESEREKEGKG